MKKLFYSLSALSILAFAACSGNANKENPESSAMVDTTQNKKADSVVADVTPPMDSAAQTKAWQDFMTPGPMHKWLASMDGKWEGESISYMGEKAMPPSKVKMENKMILNGLYQESKFTGNMMGMPFEGRGLTAYDNNKKKFINTWVDNMGSGVVMMEGTYDEGSKSLTLVGTMPDPTTGKDCPLREVIKMTDEKTQVMEMYFTKDGKEMKMLETKCSRK